MYERVCFLWGYDMAYQSIRLTNNSQIVNTVGKVSSGVLLLDRSIYQRLGSLIACKTILHDYNNNLLPKSFKNFLDELNTIGTSEATDDTIALDNYLGKLGVSETYPYSSDVKNIPQWLTTSSKSNARNIVYNDYNIVYQTYNIIT